MKISKLLFCLLALSSFTAANAATSCNLGTAPTPSTSGAHASPSMFSNETTVPCSFGVSKGKESESAPNTTLVSFPITQNGNYVCALSNIGSASYTDVKATISAANGAILGIQQLSLAGGALTFPVKADNGSGDIQVQLLNAKQYTAHSIAITCYLSNKPMTP